MTTQVAESIIKFAELAIVAYESFEKIKEFATEGYKAVDEFNMSILRTATVLTQMKASQDKNLDTKEYYNQAKEYAEGQQEIAEQVASKSIASLKNIEKEMFIINEHGLTIGASKESIDSLVSLSNAIEIVSFTARSSLKTLKAETEGLLDADIKKSQLAKQINESMGGDDNHNVLADTIRMWESKGKDVMVELAKYMQGYNASAKDYEGTWVVIENHLSTIKDEIMRMGFTELYQDINNLLVGIIKLTNEHKQQISAGIKAGWESIKSTVQAVYTILQPFAPVLSVLGGLVETISKGLLYISVGILPSISSRVASIISQFVDMGSVLAHAIAQVGYAVTFQVGKASEQAQLVKNGVNDFIKHGQQSLQGGLSDSIYKDLQKANSLIANFSKQQSAGSPSTNFKAPAPKGPAVDTGKAKSAGDLSNLRDYYNVLMDELYSATQTGIAKDLADTTRWLTEKLNKIKEFQRKGVISSQEAIKAIDLAMKGAVTKDDKIIEDYHKKRIDFERDITFLRYL